MSAHQSHKSSQFRVACINPPYFPRFSRSQRSPGVIKSGTMYYPYWLAHAAAVLEKHDFDIYLFDCPAANVSRDELLIALDKYEPQLCLIETSTASSQADFETAKFIKDRFPNVKVCLVGTHATATWQDTLSANPWIDFVAIGEYDFITLDLAMALRDKSKQQNADEFRMIPALGFRDASNVPARGPIRPPIEDIDSLPWIAPMYKRFLDSKNYYFSLASYPMIMLIGGRGCIAQCTYCVYPQVMHGHRYRVRSPESIVKEMHWIQENMPEVREVVFEDDTFTGNRVFAREVARLVKEMGVTLPWFANIRTNVDRETLASLREAGLRCCATGFESGDDVLLKNMWKGQSVAASKKFIRNAQGLGILVHGCFMVGFPGETKGTMQKTLDLALDLQPDSAQFYPVMPFPGTAYYNWAKANGYLATDDFREWLNDEGGHRTVLNLPGLRAEDMDHFCERAVRRFHFRPKYMWFKFKQGLRTPSEGIRSVKSFVFFLGYLFSKRRKLAGSFAVPSLPAQKDWHRVHQMPSGRMQAQSKALLGTAGRNSEESEVVSDLLQISRQAPLL